MEENKIEIGDVEDFRSDSDGKFSHQSLVMKAMSKALDMGSKELIEGFYDENQKDNRGNTKVVYSEDTRRTFIEAVKNCEMVMVCDYDKEARDNIKTIYANMKAERKKLLGLQKEYYDNADYDFQQNNYTDANFFNIKFHYYNYFIEAQVDFYREIFKELTLLTKRISFYESEQFEA